MSKELTLNEYRIFTNNPARIDNEVIIVDSVRENDESPHTCKLIIHKMTSSRDDKIKVEFDVQMVFDPDGSRLEILLDANPWKGYEFVELLKNVRHMEWGSINMKFDDEEIKGKHVIELHINTFHGDDPFKLQIKNIKIG